MKDHVTNTILLWRELKLPVTPPARLFEVHIVYQMKTIIEGLASKSESYGKSSSRW